MANQDKQSGPLLDDVNAAVLLASDALTNDSADMTVAVLAGFILLAVRASGAITEAAKLINQRIDLSVRAIVASAEARNAALVECLRDCVTSTADGSEPH